MPKSADLKAEAFKFILENHLARHILLLLGKAGSQGMSIEKLRASTGDPAAEEFEQALMHLKQRLLVVQFLSEGRLTDPCLSEPLGEMMVDVIRSMAGGLELHIPLDVHEAALSVLDPTQL